jgi:uncharacterized protein (DUF952 family)
MSRRIQLPTTAHRLFAGQKGLLLACIHLGKVEGQVVWEGRTKFRYYPHLFGRITPQSVCWVKGFSWDDKLQDFRYPVEWHKATA